MLRFQSNGSRWAGQPLATFAELLDVLTREPLDPTFERYGDFIYRDGDSRLWFMFGNFAHLSHVFNLATDEPLLALRFARAVRANKRTRAYEALALPQRMAERARLAARARRRHARRHGGR